MIKIMLDPGHSGDYFNASPVVPGYYESNMAWTLTHKLKAELEKYGFYVGLTRTNKYEDPELTTRGMKAKGYDLFLSLHSNAAGSEAPDAPWIIHFNSDNKTNVDDKSEAVARILGPVVSEVMGVSEPYYYTKRVDFDRDGNGYIDDEYYGVLFGAKCVGVPGVIIEHSFHTNIKATKWLMDDSNLQRLAEEEAKAIAEYFGIKEEDLPMTEAERKDFNKLTDTVRSLEERVFALCEENDSLQKIVNELFVDNEYAVKRIERYDDMGVYDNAAIKWAYIDKNLPKWAKPTIKKLVDKEYLKGNDKGSLELSYLMMRILVILDRAGMFN
jgi:N-acetylmuramoyl-L-alanine amidase